jgi:hypothetical protein
LKLKCAKRHTRLLTFLLLLLLLLLRVCAILLNSVYKFSTLECMCLFFFTSFIIASSQVEFHAFFLYIIHIASSQGWVPYESKTKGCVTLWPCPFTLKSILMQTKELVKLKYFTKPKKYNLQKNFHKKSKSCKILWLYKTNLKVQDKPKYQILSKTLI